VAIDTSTEVQALEAEQAKLSRLYARVRRRKHVSGP
jgi:hypothetical protein